MVTPYELDVVLKLLRDLNRQAGPVPAWLVGDFLGKADNTTRYYLRRLERTGYVVRPYGCRRGWVAVA